MEDKLSLEQRVISSLRPSFRESVSIRSAHWALYNHALDDVEAICLHETKQDAIKILNKLMAAYPSSSSNHQAYADCASCFEENDVEYKGKFRYN